MAAYVFLEINGYELEVDDKEIYEWTIRLADHRNRPKFERKRLAGLKIDYA